MAQARHTFHVELIKPSHYDDDGYVIQWLKAWIPSNSLASMYGLTLEAGENNALGEDVDIRVQAYDETNTIIPVRRIIKRIQKAGGEGLVCMVGVQSNQFPRAMDMARQFRAAGVQVAIGGFHVSGCLSMLPELPVDLQEALDLGITLFAGESEGRFMDLLRAAQAKRMEPLYNYMDDLPGMEGQRMPYLPPEVARRYAPMPGTFDAGRGCPFLCSFCTIINVQGRKSRYRSPDDVERLLRANLAHGIRHYFIKVLKDPAITSDTSRLANYAEIIKEESTRLLHQVENVLQSTIIEEKRAQVSIEKLDAHQLIAKVVDGYRLMNAEKAVRLSLKASQSMINADDIHFSNAIKNLIDNAIKYSSAEPEITVSTTIDGRWLLISVSDKGLGIAREHQRKVFQKFYRVPTGDRHDIKGFGIGLHYARNIVKLHGGDIALQSSFGEGSVFTIKVPLANEK
jgi:two-component sensor histidine kinase